MDGTIARNEQSTGYSYANVSVPFTGGLSVVHIRDQFRK